MLVSFLTRLLVVISVPLGTAGVVYHVKPTAHNSSCPTNDTCHTMDHYASNSSHYFSPDHINVTLYFMCGVHNCTQHMDISDLRTFAMIGTAGRHHVIISMPIPTEDTVTTRDMGSQHFYTFTNVSNVTMKNISIRCISVSFEGKESNFNATSVNFYGYTNATSQNVSVIDITGSLALFDNCTFQENSFLHYQSNAEITIHDCIFHSYNHMLYSAIRGLKSILNLLGSVHFINNTIGSSTSDYRVCGAAVYLAYDCCSTEDKDLFYISRSTLNINDEAFVHFVNNTADCGGAVFLSTTTMNVGNKVNMNFFFNKARKIRPLLIPGNFWGGAVLLDNSSISTGVNAKLHFVKNFAGWAGGAIGLFSHSEIWLNSNTVVNFTSNVAVNYGGAMSLTYSNIYITGNTSVYFLNNVITNKGGGGALSFCYSKLVIRKSILFIGNNSALSHIGGGIYTTYSHLNICEYSKVKFTNNLAFLQGGAIYMSIGDNLSVQLHSILKFIKNFASKGGALYLLTSATVSVGYDSVVFFTNNSVSDCGGAVYTNIQFDLPCFLVLMNYSGAIIFQGNVARSGIGMDVYGASISSSTCATHSVFSKFNTLPYCGHKANINFIPSNHNSNLSLVSSSPKRVCLCDSNGYPQCANLSKIFVNGLKVYSGEPFKLLLAVVGHDFGVTKGVITAKFIRQKGHSQPKLDQSQYHQWLNFSKPQCSNMTYTIISTNENESMYLQTTNVVRTYGNKDYINVLIRRYHTYSNRGCLNPNLLSTPVYVNISILPGCPPGFRFDEDIGCTCFQILNINQFKCDIKNNTGYIKWNGTMWVNAKNDTIIISQHCPLGYCLSDEKVVNLASNPDTQCDFNHAGTLCGGCENHYSLAIGSSRCIQCSSNSYMALFLFFIVAGIIFVIFILVLNVTVTQGLINGLILYANLLWTYKDILFPSELKPVTFVFQIFIAWLNLDFGIETCLVVGLTAFWKTWLQFLFPLYIWLIAGVIIIVCRYSSCLTNLIGDRAVPLLATLFLFSYTKLLRTVMIVLVFGELKLYPDESTTIVWYFDGNLSYCQHPHIYLFIAAITTLFFCLSFTLFLLLIQCWRRISHLRLLRWINKFIPFYDAYFAPLEDKHHYWFGTLLLVRIALLISFTATSSTLPFISLFILQLTSVVLLFYTSIRHVYKSKLVRMLESTSLLNLTILIGFTLYTRGGQTTFLEVSIAFAFIQFTFIIIISLIKIFFNVRRKCMGRDGYHLLSQDVDSSDEMVHERVEDPEVHDQFVCSRNLRNTVETY